MRYEDASQISTDVTARDDTEHLAGNDFGPATGNLITGTGTVSGATGTDSGGSITAIVGAGGSDDSFDSNGMLEVAGQYGTLTIDAQGNYTYVRAPGSPEGVSDTFTYTLANEAGATDTAQLVIAIGDLPILQAQGTQTILQNGNVVVLPPGVELSDVRVVGRDLVITLPDGSTMVIPDGAVFVPQLVVNGVEVPASNLAALLIDAEPRPAAGDATVAQQSSGGNFGLPPGPLDPGVPLGDLLPPTELDYTPPEVDELFDAFENDPPVISPSSVNVSDEGVSTVDVPIPDNSGSPDTTNERIVNGHINVVDPDGDSVTITLGEPTNALTSQGDPIEWSVSPDGHTVIGTAGGIEVIRIVIENDGDYTVTQSRPIDHPNTSIEDGVSFVVPVFATDGEDFAVPGAITVTIEDDSPVVEGLTVRGGVTLDETEAGSPSGFPIDGTTDGPIIVNDDGGFGADGPAAEDSIVYGLGLTGGVAELASGIQTAIGDHPITLVQADSVTIEGVYDDGGEQIAFTIVMNPDGSVTLTQNVPLEHLVDGPPGPDHDDSLDLDGLVDATVTYTDFDGDSDTDSAPIGGNLVFKDDGPTAGLEEGFQIPDFVVDESPIGEDEGGDNDPAGVRSVTLDLSGAFAGPADFGADGEGSVDYALTLNGEDLGTGMFALDPSAPDGQGDEILLVDNGDGTISGVADGVTYFTISVDGDGNVTFEQSENVWHADDTSDDDTSFLSAAPGTILLEQTVTDSDGDFDTAELDLSDDVFQIEDDGPSAELNEQFEMPTLVVDESPVGEDEGGDNDPAGVRTATFDFSAAFGESSFGTDGPGTVEYGLVLSSEGAESGLFALGAGGAQGDAILLFTEADGSITGRTTDENGPIYFTISVVETGVDAGEVTFEQELNVWHADDSSDDDTSSLVAEAGTITLEQTVTDADGDSETAGIDLSDGVFEIEDDGPSGEDPVEPDVPTLVVDESPIGEDEEGDHDPAGVRTDTASFAALFGTVDHGTDGPGTVEYGLTLSSEGAESGLFALGVDGAQGDAILLFTEADGSITGRTTDENGPIYFTISVVESGPGAGDVTFEQELNVWHADDTSDDDTSTLSAEPGTILLNQVVTDADGDTDGGSIDLSAGVFNIEDDGPSTSLNEQFEMPTLVVDESPIGVDEDGDNDPAGVRTATFDFSVAFGAADFGTDGPGTVEYGLVLSSEGAESGLFALGAGGAQGDAILLFTEADGSITGRTGDENGPIYFTISVVETGVDAGEVTFEQELNVWHADDSSDDDTSFLNADPGTITLEQTVTDADGDSETIGLDLSDDVFAIEDDGPSGEDPVEPNVPNLVVDESPIGEDEGGDDDPAGVRTDTASFAALFGTVDHGTDGPGTVTYALELSSEGEESGLFALGTNGAQGAAILLFTEADGSITGRTTDENGPIYFTISVVESGPGAGDVTFEQSLNVWHADDTSDDDTSTLNAEPGTILLNQIVTDADGDVDGGAIDLSVGVFHIEDDGPAAADDTDTVGAPGTTATGNVITDNAVGDQGDTDDGADDVGTDTPGRITAVVSVNEPGNTDSDADPNVFEIQGEFGVLVINANGSYTYTRDEGSPGGGEEVFTYTLTDADGDSEEANLTIQIADEVPVAGTETATVDDDGLVGSPDGVLEAGINDINANLGETPATNANEAIFNGTLNATGGDGALTFSLVEPADGAAIGQETVNYTLVGNLLTATIATSPVGARVGDTLFTVELVDPSTGDYVVTLEDNVLHGNDANEDEDGIEVQVTVLYQVEDSDGSTSVADGELTISFNDDIPTVAVNAEVEPNLEVDESDLTVDAGPTSFAGLFDVDFGADGPAATGALDFELNINTGDTGLFDTATGEEIVLVKVGETIEGRTDTTNQLSFVISVNADGELSLDQQRAIIHDDEMDPNDVETMDADSLITLSVTATDADGDSVTVEDPINIAQNFLFFDDGPTTYEPEDASVTNEAGAAVFFDLDDTGQGGNDDIGDNFGADGPGVVRFPSTLHASDSGETSGGVTIWYFLSNDGQTLTAKTGATAELAEAGTGVVFTVNLNQATDQYSVQMFGTVDNLGEVIFDEANFDFVGGNETWFGIVPNDQGPDDTPVDDESHDLLITPTNETSVNTSGILGGIDTGQSVGTGEGFRIDYVIDLTGEPAGGGADYQDGVDNGHFLNVEPGDVPSHYTTNGAFFTVRQSDGSDILIKAFDDTDNDDVVGDGSQEAITKIVIRYTIEGVNPGDDPIVFSSGELTPTTTEQFVTLNGIEFSYELDDDGMSVHVGNVQGATGANEFPNTTISTSTADGYNSLEVYWEGGQTFKFAGFGIQDQLLEPVEISLPTEIVDGDGDVVAGGDIDLTLTPAGAETLLASTSMESREAFDGGETSSFSLLSSNDTQQLEKTAANSNNVVLAAAIGAAGFVATGAAAQTPHFDVGGDFATNALVGKQALADFGGTEIGGGKFADLSSFMESGGFEFGAMAMASTSHQAMAASHIGELTTNLSLGSGPNALLEATDFGGMLQMPAPAMGMDVAMVSADALMPQVAGVNAQTTGAVEQILADALQGGGSAPDIDALLNALPGGANVGLQNLATQAGDHVPTWDMGHGDVFTFDVASIITMQAMALHPDAVQPVANG